VKNMCPVFAQLDIFQCKHLTVLRIKVGFGVRMVGRTDAHSSLIRTQPKTTLAYLIKFSIVMRADIGSRDLLKPNPQTHAQLRHHQRSSLPIAFQSDKQNPLEILFELQP
jgi:hypothetical protein